MRVYWGLEEEHEEEGAEKKEQGGARGVCWVLGGGVCVAVVSTTD